MEMEGAELNLNKENCKSSNDGFIDRSKVKILLCDNDSNNSEEVLTLLLRCSYQVTSVKSARQVIDALNADGPDIDIILSEVDLPMAKGMKMLKYITRDKELRRIPVIMMSAQDEVSIVVKCLRLGAADYLVKPLRTNELLNLWTHMWRRRRMLGLAEKNVLSYDFDLMASDPSDANTNSTTLFSDDTDDKSHKSTNPETAIPMQQEDEFIVAAVTGTDNELSQAHVSGYQPDVPGISDRISDRRTELGGNLSSGPRKSELRIGESSAFLTYVKSPVAISNSQRIITVDDSSTQREHVKDKKRKHSSEDANDLPLHASGEIWDNHSREDLPNSNSIPDSLSLERSCTSPTSTDQSLKGDSEEKNLPQGILHPKSGSRGLDLDMAHLPPQHTYPSYYVPGVVNQVMMPSSARLYPNNMQDLQNHGMMAQYNPHIRQCSPHANGITSFPYYPVGICLQPGLSANQPWPSFGNSSTSELKLSKVDRREAALMKFRQKRKERCFDKKIRYVNRKHLAERRPRVRGQFVRKVNGVSVDLNGEPTSADFEEEEEENEEERPGRESSPVDNVRV